MKTLLKSEILRRARVLIEDNSEIFICYAIDKVYFRNKRIGWLPARDIQDWIMWQIEPSATFRGWLNREHPKKYSLDNYDSMRQCRLAWIDWMIAQYEAHPEINANRRRSRKAK